MRKYFILLACLAIISCKKAEEGCCPEDALVDSVAVAAPADEPNSDSIVVKISESLEKSENVEQGIQCVVEERTTLKVQNKKLTTELKTTKDSLEKVKYELKETKLKLPKKRSFLQKVLGTGKDSVEVIKADTVQTN